MSGKLVLALLGGLMLGCVAAQADEAADFYNGKTVTLLVGYGPGGGYDIYARVLARYIGKYIPGHPKVIVQNMPGAGSLRATNFIYNAAPKDGTLFGTFARNMALLGLLKTNQNVKFDPAKFTWLGSSASFANDAYLLIVRRDAKDKTIEDMRRPGGPPLLLGSTAEGTSSDVMPVVLRDMLGFNLKVISGYNDSATLFLALERGEVEGRTVGLSAVRAAKPDWLKPGGPMHALVAFGRATRLPALPDVPTARELARTAKDRTLIELLETPYRLSRPFAAPPGIPPARAKALQAAFMAVHKDKDYLADAAKLGIDVSPIDGDEIRGIIAKLAKMPPAEMRSVQKLIEGG